MSGTLGQMEKYGGRQKVAGEESGMTSDAQLGKAEVGAGKWSHSGRQLNGLQSMRKSSHNPCFLDCGCPNLGIEQVQMGREVCGNGQQARIRVKHRQPGQQPQKSRFSSIVQTIAGESYLFYH